MSRCAVLHQDEDGNEIPCPDAPEVRRNPASLVPLTVKVPPEHMELAWDIIDQIKHQLMPVGGIRLIPEGSHLEVDDTPILSRKSDSTDQPFHYGGPVDSSKVRLPVSECFPLWPKGRHEA